MKRKLKLKKKIREAIKTITILTVIWMILTAALFAMADYIEYRENLYETYQNK